MRMDSVIKTEGFKALSSKLDIVEIERFITLINRGAFNYTEWRKTLWEDMSVEELSSRADDFWNRESIRTSAMGDMESEESLYSMSDLKEVF